MSAASLAHAEKTLLVAAGASKADLRRAVRGSVRLDGFVIDWTERVSGEQYARTASVSRDDVLDVLAEQLATTKGADHE